MLGGIGDNNDFIVPINVSALNAQAENDTLDNSIYTYSIVKKDSKL